MLIKTLSITKEATHRGWCVSIEWPIGWVSLIQVICWGMKLSAFYTRCERACNSCPSAQAFRTRMCCKFVRVSTCRNPCFACSFFSEITSLNLFIQGNVALAFEEVFSLPPFFTQERMWHTFSLSGQRLAYLFFGATFSFLNLFTTDNMLKNPTSGLNKYDDWKLLSFVV